MNTAPAMTNASLFANSTFLPALAAARAGRKPAAPTMAAITVSASGRLAMRSKDSMPAITVVSAPAFVSICSSLVAIAADPTTA
ncbi:hypothetical protein RHDC1_00363 [Rhodocyclaceae bacterium]|nr:hypothetical protein RHDC1_00363 [Rhodocyclaceae bacterium]